MLVFALGMFTPTMAMFLDSGLLLKLLACKLLLFAPPPLGVTLGTVA